MSSRTVRKDAAKEALFTYPCNYGSCPRMCACPTSLREHRERAHDASETGEGDRACVDCGMPHRTHVSAPIPWTSDAMPYPVPVPYVCLFCSDLRLERDIKPQFFYDRMLDDAVWLKTYAVLTNSPVDVANDGSSARMAPKRRLPDRMWAACKSFPVGDHGWARILCVCVGENDEKRHVGREAEPVRDDALMRKAVEIAEHKGCIAIEYHTVRVSLDPYVPAPGEPYTAEKDARMRICLRELRNLLTGSAPDVDTTEHNVFFMNHYIGYPPTHPRIVDGVPHRIYLV